MTYVLPIVAAIFTVPALRAAGRHRSIGRLRMERTHVSRASVEIAASNADVWDALVTRPLPESISSGLRSTQTGRSEVPSRFTGSFNGNSYHGKRNHPSVPAWETPAIQPLRAI